MFRQTLGSFHFVMVVSHSPRDLVVHTLALSRREPKQMISDCGMTGRKQLQQGKSMLAGVPDTKQLRKALSRFATGVAIMTTCSADGKLQGVTSNSFASVSLDPPLILWCLARTAASFAGFSQARHFAVNVLASHQVKLSRNFSAPQANKFAGVSFRPGIGQCPVLSDAIGLFECETERLIDGGDHAIIIGRVLTATMTGGEPLIFVDGKYRQTTALVPDTTG